MKAVRTVEDKTSALKERQEEQRKLGRVIDRLIADGNVSHDEVASGYMGRGLCSTIGRGVARFLGISQRARAVSTKEVEIASVAVAKDSATRSTGSEISRAVLGLAPSKKKTPQSKLAAASEAMRARVESLESRASEGRAAAAAAMKAGNKASAMRELKRAKMLEKQALSTQGAMDALEAQSDMLEQTALQKEVAAALGATAKSLKKEKGLLSKAEDAVDAAAEMRDMHEDLTQVMAGLGDAVSNDVDEDELLEELQSMVADNDTEPTAPDVEAVSAHSELAEKAAMEQAALEKKHKEYEQLERIRQQLPSAPKGPVERQGLLADTQ
jgi:hypothetical protein